MRTAKRLLSMLLSCAMVLSLVTVPVLATDDFYETQDESKFYDSSIKGSITITPSIETAVASDQNIQVVYTVSVTPPEGKYASGLAQGEDYRFATFNFNLDPPDNVTINSVATNSNLVYTEDEYGNPQKGFWALVGYTANPNKEIRAGGNNVYFTAESAAQEEYSWVARVRATIAAGAYGSFAMGVKKIMFSDGVDDPAKVFKMNFNSTPLVITREATGIAVDTVNSTNKTNYIQGQDLDVSGLRVDVTYSNGDVETLQPTATSGENAKGLTFSNYNKNTVGQQTVTVAYGGQSTTFNVTVNPKAVSSVAKKTDATKNSGYIEGQSFDPAGMVVTVTYNDNSTKDVTLIDAQTGNLAEGVSIVPKGATANRPLATTDTQVTITYTDDSVAGTQSGSFDYTIGAVAAKKVKAIEKIAGPASFKVGQAEDWSTLRFNVTYDNNVATDVDEVAYAGDEAKFAITGFNSASAVPSQTINVTYTRAPGDAKGTSFTIAIVEKVIDHIAVTTNATKSYTSYVEGQSFDAAGMTVTAYYDNNTSEQFDFGNANFTQNFDITPSVPLTLNNSAVVVSYKGQYAGEYTGVNAKKVNIPITVAAKQVSKIDVTHAADKTNYVVGQDLDLTGLEITATYNDGDTKVIPQKTANNADGYVVSGYNKNNGSAVGTTQAVTVTYSGKTKTFNVTVTTKKLTGLAVKTAPTKTEYSDGETFSTKGMVLTATYNDGIGGTADITSGYTYPTDAFVLADANQQETQDVIITYTDAYGTATATQQVTVIPAAVESISVGGEFKNTYKVADEADWTGMFVLLNWNNGRVQRVIVTPDEVGGTYNGGDIKITGFDSSAAGSKTITVKYKDDKTTTTTVRINENEVPEGKPTLSKTELTYGEKLSAITLSGNLGNVEGTFAWNNADAKPDAAEYYTAGWTFTPTAGGEQVIGNSVIKIKKATVTGRPTYSNINAAGKTLADANLAKGGITVDGVIAWELPTNTSVSANVSYKWTFTPDDTKNYESRTESVTLWTVSNSGGGSSGSSGGGGGGGGGTPTSYQVTIGSVSNGSVSTSPENASSGKKVTITVKPNEGYKLDKLTVTDASGKEVTLTKVNDTTYTFTMPAKKVSVASVFVKEEEKPNEQNPDEQNPVEEGWFIDVPTASYYYDSVKWAQDKGITSGTSEKTFSPADSCTRAQMVTFIWRAMGCPEPTITSVDFVDCDSNAYYYKAMLWAYEKGITLGTSATTFSPDETVTREQSVTFLYRAVGDESELVGENPFADNEKGTFSYEAILWAYENGITNGTSETTFSGTDDCLRAQIVTFLYRSFAEQQTENTEQSTQTTEQTAQ